MLTRQGWLVGVGAGALLLVGRVLGLVELFALGVVAAALLAGCVLLVMSARLELEVGRAVHPARVHVGTSSRVDLTIRNLRDNGTPVLRLRDPCRARGAPTCSFRPWDEASGRWPPTACPPTAAGSSRSDRCRSS